MAALTNDQILDAIASMSVLEVSELVKAMEEKFGVTAAVAVAAGPAAAGGAAAGGEEQTEFTVTLESFDAAKKILTKLQKFFSTLQKMLQLSQ